MFLEWFKPYDHWFIKYKTFSHHYKAYIIEVSRSGRPIVGSHATTPFRLRKTREIDCQSGAPYLLAAPSNLPHGIGLPKLCYSYVEWTVDEIEPRTFRLQGEHSTDYLLKNFIYVNKNHIKLKDDFKIKIYKRIFFPTVFNMNTTLICFLIPSLHRHHLEMNRIQDSWILRHFLLH